MLVPFEVARQISGYLSQKEALECLLVCKNWYRPMLESLYSSVVLRTCRSFRVFLYVIAHHELTPGKFVKELELYIEDFNERPVTFTEFELLSRYCINLNDLQFSHTRYWRCMNELDLTNTWPHLRKVPTSRNKISFEVCYKIKDRLEEVAFFAQDESILAFISSPCPKLLKLEVATRHLLLTIDTIRSIHHCAPFVQNLCLMACMENISDNSFNVPPLIDEHNNHVQHLKCLIHHPDSAWFSVIKSTYHSIDTLTLIISNIPPRQSGYISRPYTKFEIVRSIIDLIKGISIRDLEMDFKFVADISFMQAATATLLYDHCNKVLNKSMSVSVRASFIIPGDFDYHHGFKSKLKTLESSNKVAIHHELEYRFIREFDDENDDYSVSELDLLEYTIVRPINKLVLHLSMNIGTRDEFFWTNVMTNKQHVHFDQILSYFSNLESLTVTSNLSGISGSNPDSEVKLTLSSATKKTDNSSLKCLTVQSASIDKCIFQFLFKHCTALTKLILTDCQIDDVTTLVLECLSLESDILLEINQDSFVNSH
ncbi:hypothetical protein [Parasitella parasitica]|uniref:F-box domain-containing protein n=1 Tax=Parasitella parasitica TaxID=35722 RepID=A0A0B7NJQ7_9FUNG|nr:hypothetical protein [Parasitella parasitica]